MPELPDVTLYVEALSSRIAGRRLIRAIVKSPFLLRSADPPLSATYGAKVREIKRLGKQIAIAIGDQELWLVIHLMIAGRLHWNIAAPKLGSRNLLAAFEFDNGWLWLTEAGKQRRAALHVVRSAAGLQALSAGGIEPLEANLAAFIAAIVAANHTLKRALTDPHILSGIGNAYSDEILHRAQLSPIAMTQKLTAPELARLYEATRKTLIEWTDRLRTEAAGAFPEKVTAFRPEMAVQGRYSLPCPRCGAKVQRIRYASNETNYCAPCQTGGRLLADRALSRLLHADWPRTLEELEARKQR
ncbi:MAG TPA: DNA-formamidopyrimidine glycosylase family protein [Candidatus Binataceae bacterium]|nr:DNA-formamidopyrimidine glycosylase family protein [Candidatus Binataceae bacterium]